MNNPRTISILGSTGSIGVQTLEVLDSFPDSFKIGYLTANTKIDRLAEQVRQYNPVGVAISDEKSYFEFKKKYSFDCEILCGEEGVCIAAAYSKNGLIVQSLVGFSGVKPTLSAIYQGTEVALANKETLVSAGNVVTNAAKENNIRLTAIDSEHSAILQCLIGESVDEVEKIILTGSGGPFRDFPKESFEDLTVEQALSHPNWTMGNKITIDSATMMNKGFEVIEAYWLFGLTIEQIDVVIHPQSIIHSLVQFIDGSVKAQLGMPDMRIPISYALSYPKRLNYNFPRLNLSDITKLEFFKPDFEKFRCLQLAFNALQVGGTAPAIVNAANEIAVGAFLNKEIKFSEIPVCIEDALIKINVINNPNIDEIVNTDLEVRKVTKNFIKTRF